MRRRAAFGLALVIAAGCRPTATTFEADVAWRFAYEEGPISPETRVFLVAGGDDVANFAAEIVSQRALWLAAGLREEEIACYYAKPTEAAWREDREQYEALLPMLTHCHRAEPGRLHRDLELAAAGRPPWIYLYVSAHGVPSQYDLARTSRSPRIRSLAEQLETAERQQIDITAIGLQAGPGPRLEEVPRVIRGLRHGVRPRDLVLTPWTLYESLASFGADTLRIVVLQACFSGGFLMGGGTPSLATLPSTVVLTAAAADRRSFGCDPGAARTHFGGAFEVALARALEREQDPTYIDWPALYEQIVFAVEAMEAVEGTPASAPQLADTRRR